jgi:hypothetical protein
LEDGAPCDDGDDCTRDNGQCIGGICEIEVFCDDIPNAACAEAAVVYEMVDGVPSECRLDDDKVGVTVEVEPSIQAAGSLVPVRMILRNSPEYLGNVSGWSKPVHRVYIVLTLNPADVVEGGGYGRVAYVFDSAVLEGGKYGIEETQDGNERVVLELGVGEETNDSLPEPEQKGYWVLDLVLMRGTAQSGVFGVEVGVPCHHDEEVSPGEIDLGCHCRAGDDLSVTVDGACLQRVSATVYASTTGKVVDPDEDNVDKLLQSPVLGCQCGRTGGGGWGWLLLLTVLVVIRRYRTCITGVGADTI